VSSCDFPTLDAVSLRALDRLEAVERTRNVHIVWGSRFLVGFPDAALCGVPRKGSRHIGSMGLGSICLPMLCETCVLIFTDRTLARGGHHSDTVPVFDDHDEAC
jgi:hypothetical protein